MVYEVKCANCGDIINFGGHDPEEGLGPGSKLPENAIEFNDEVYCEACVKKFVEFGIGDVEERIDFLEDQIKDMRKELGMEKGLND
jgi:hypothetical protein